MNPNHADKTRRPSAKLETIRRRAVRKAKGA